MLAPPAGWSELSVGTEIDRDQFDAEDYRRFAARLRENLKALRRLFERPGFGAGPASIGVELEMSLVDSEARPLLHNQALVAQMRDPRFTVELNQFNIECNSTPTELSGRPFSQLAAELQQALAQVDLALGEHGRAVAVGILPTLEVADLDPSVMTNIPRYRALAAGLRQLRHGPFDIAIDGLDPLRVTWNDVTMEGANTSLQLHIRVEPERFCVLHNAAQMATAPALAISGNSPSFLGHWLWDETRVALFKQAVDDRRTRIRGGFPMARVAFGSSWTEGSAVELFDESVRLYGPLLPVVGDEDSLACLAAGRTPSLAELRLHHGTVWRWNRAVYDPVEGGHLRIELRALPAGPTVIDMMASSAFLLGLSRSLAADRTWRAAMPFDAAHTNFYRAAQHGLDADLVWPAPSGGLETLAAGELARRLIPRAAEGLRAAGVDEAEVERLLGIVEARLSTAMTGARWQRRRARALEPSLGRSEALKRMFLEYMEHSAGGCPVHTWPTS